ncbi:hypothetical protein [Paenibacillus rhizolycopersici]|uniref:hypothetical protein n=1 Tax=Paenibacillus rhizolycopersici TaxID=2780073 RepID=UPI003D2C4CDF
MAVVKNLMVRAGADFSSMRKEMQKAQRDLASFKTGVNKTIKGIGVALAGLGVGSAIKSAMNDAMQFEAAITQLNRTMGSSAGAFRKWADENAAAFGMSRLEIVKYGAVYSNLISSFSSGTAETTQRTEDLLRTSAIVAAATGRTMEDTMERIRSGLLGNTEAIEDLGINVNVALLESTNAFKQLANGQHWEQLNFQTQQQIRLMAILEQANVKYGDSIANTTIARQNQLIAQLKNVKLSLGQAFQPIYNYILPALIRFATALATVMNFIAQFTTALFGGTAKAQQAQANATNAQAGAVSGLGDAYKDAGNQAKAAGKKAKGAAASFDQLNLIGKSGADAGGGSDASGGGGAVGAVGDGLLGGVGNGMVEVSQKAQEMADKVKAAFENMKSFVVRNKDIIIAATVGIAAAFGGMWLAANGGAIAKGALDSFKALAAFANPISLLGAAVGLIVGLATVLYLKWDDLDNKWKIIGTALLGSAGLIVFALKTVEKHWDDIAAAAQNIWQSVFVPFGNWLADGFKAAWEAVTEAAGWLWKNVLVPLGEFLKSFYDGVLKPLGAILVDALGMGFEFVADVAKDFWKTVLVPFGDFLSSTFSEAIQALSDIFDFWWKNVLKPLGSWIKANLEPTFKTLGDTITYIWQNVLRPFGEFMLGNFKTIFHTVFTTIGDLIGDLKTTLSGLINFIAGVFTGDWKRAWNGVKDIFAGIFGGLYDVVKTPLNMIIDALNKLIDGLNSLDIDLPDWMGGGKFGLNIKKIPRLAKGGLAYGPTLAMVGDNRGASSDPEVIAPLSKLEGIMGGGDQQVVGVLNAILRAVQSGQNVNVTISQKAITDAAVNGIKDHQRRTGALPFPV